MNTVMQFLSAHQIIATAAVGYVWAAVIGALPAPTVNSSTFYQFMFKFLNLLAANISRAQATAVENSPNWQAALAKATLPKP